MAAPTIYCKICQAQVQTLETPFALYVYPCPNTARHDEILHQFRKEKDEEVSFYARGEGFAKTEQED